MLADAAGCLLAEGGVLGPQPGDLLVCGVQAGAQRFGAGALGGPGGGCPCWFGAQPGDQVAGGGVAVEPGPGDAGCGGDGAEGDWLAGAVEALDGLAGFGGSSKLRGLVTLAMAS